MPIHPQPILGDNNKMKNAKKKKTIERTKEGDIIINRPISEIWDYICGDFGQLQKEHKHSDILCTWCGNRVSVEGCNKRMDRSKFDNEFDLDNSNCRNCFLFDNFSHHGKSRSKKRKKEE